MADLDIFDFNIEIGFNLEMKIAGYKPEHNVPAMKIPNNVNPFSQPNETASGIPTRLLSNGKLA